MCKLVFRAVTLLVNVYLSPANFYKTGRGFHRAAA